MSESERAARGWGATVAGVVLAVAGFGVLLWAIFTAQPTAIQLNTTTMIGGGTAGLGIALAAIGLDRGAPKFG